MGAHEADMHHWGASRAAAAPAKSFCEVWPLWSEHRVRCDSMKGSTPSTTGNGSMQIINLAGKGLTDVKSNERLRNYFLPLSTTFAGKSS